MSVVGTPAGQSPQVGFVKRKIDISITLGTGDFGSGPAGSSNTVTATGLRCSAQITKAGQPSADQANIRIWGLTEEVMNKATDLGKPLSRPRNNIVTVSAGDDTSGMSQVFSGMILTAYGDFSDPPNAALTISAISNQVEAAAPVKPISFTGGADVVTVMSQIASSMGKNVQNWGVKGVQLASPYFPGTAIQQMNACARAAGINVTTSDGNPVEIWPKDGQRGQQIPLISPTSGLWSYPLYCDVGVALRTLYMPGLIFGGNFMLDTSITQAKGTWQIIGLQYDLESEMPDGQWFALIQGTRPADSGGGS